MKAMRLALFALTAGVVLAFPAAAAEVPNPERGRALYENHCVVCHTSKVHRRNPPSAIDGEALRYIVKVWVEEQKLRWRPAISRQPPLPVSQGSHGMRSTRSSGLGTAAFHPTSKGRQGT